MSGDHTRAVLDRTRSYAGLKYQTRRHYASVSLELPESALRRAALRGSQTRSDLVTYIRHCPSAADYCEADQSSCFFFGGGAKIIRFIFLLWTVFYFKQILIFNFKTV